VFVVSLPSFKNEGGAEHAEATSVFGVTTIPNATSLAVWDIPSPVTPGERFTVKIGAKSAADCSLRGKAIAVCDEAGAVIACGALKATPWPGTAALYWTEVELTAPAQPGVARWSARFAADDVELPHQGTTTAFSTAVVGRPEHRLTVTLLESGTGVPLDDVQVSLGPYRAATGRSGRADMDVAKGSYQLSAWKVGYAASIRTVEIDADAAVRIEAVIVPEEHPDAIWTA
jgi:hypothetical protein